MRRTERDAPSVFSVPASFGRLALPVLLGHLGGLLVGRERIRRRLGHVDRLVGARPLSRVLDADGGLALGAIGRALRSAGRGLDLVTLPLCGLSLRRWLPFPPNLPTAA